MADSSGGRGGSGADYGEARTKAPPPATNPADSSPPSSWQISPATPALEAAVAAAAAAAAASSAAAAGGGGGGGETGRSEGSAAAAAAAAAAMSAKEIPAGAATATRAPSSSSSVLLPSTPTSASGGASSAAVDAAVAAAAAAATAAARESMLSATARKRKQRTSGVWQHFENFEPAAPGGRNVRCIVMVEEPAQPELGLPKRSYRCGSTYTHVEASGGYGGSGTSGMLNHLSKKHIPEHAAIMRANAVASKKNNPDGTPSKSRRSSKGKGSSPRSSAAAAAAAAAAGGAASPAALAGLLSGPFSGVPSSGGILNGGGGGLNGTSSSGGGGGGGVGAGGAGAGSSGGGGRFYSGRTSTGGAAVARAASHRKFVLTCALFSISPRDEMATFGFKLLADELSPRSNSAFGFGPSPAAADALLSELCGEAAGRVAAALKVQRESCLRLGWGGPFVSLQVDATRTPLGHVVCTASVAFVPEDFSGLARMAVGVRNFYLTVTAPQVDAWVRQVTSEAFAAICGKVEPKDVYVAATVAGGQEGDSGDAIREALQGMGLSVTMCSDYRLHLTVARSLGASGGGGGGGGEGGEKEHAGGKMRAVVQRAMSMVQELGQARSEALDGSVPEHSREEVEELSMALQVARSNSSRWTGQYALFDRLLQLAGPIDAFFRQNSGDSALRPSEMQAIREAVSILDPASEVLAETLSEGGSAGGGGGRGRGGGGAAAAAAEAAAPATSVLLGEAIGLHANLHQSFVYPAQDIRSTDERDGPVSSRQVEDLTPEAQELLGALGRGMEESGLGRAAEDAEAASLLLDPAFKNCCPNSCANGGSVLKLRALTVVTAELRAFEGAVEEAYDEGGVGPRAAAHSPSPSASPPALPQRIGGGGGGAGMGGGGGGAAFMKLSRLDKMRQAQTMSLGRSRAGAGGGEGDSGGAPRRPRAEEAVTELGEYMLEPVGRRQGLLEFWKLNGSGPRGAAGSGTERTVPPARWPHLGLLARLHAGVDTTSRQARRHFGSLDLGSVVGVLQASMPPGKVEQMVLVKLNSHLVREVAELRGRAMIAAARGHHG